MPAKLLVMALFMLLRFAIGKLADETLLIMA
jgi:hypothetical protein